MISSHTRCAFGAISLCALVAAASQPATAHEGHVHKRAIAQAQTGAASVAPPREPTLAEVRQATERFQDVKVALAEGYLRDPPILRDGGNDGPASGTRRDGRPLFPSRSSRHHGAAEPACRWHRNPHRLRKPAILIYEPQAGGSLELVAVENLVFRQSWHASGSSAPPAFQGLAYDTMADDLATAIDEAHNFEPHYDRHVWIYRDEPERGVHAVQPEGVLPASPGQQPPAHDPMRVPSRGGGRPGWRPAPQAHVRPQD